jgi:iron complex transport system ATP-binding protein
MSSRSEPSVLSLDAVQFRYPGCDTILRDLSFAVENGEFIGLLGANGSGKSTALKLAAGILRPREGRVTLWGKPMGTYRTRDRAKLLSYFPQHLDVAVPFTVRELASMGLYPYDIPPHMTVEDAIETVGLSDKSESYITNLSGGEKRRAFIAMTLVQGAGLVLLDEPLANLDIKYQVELLRLLHQLKRDRNISVIMALHDINLALQFEKVILIKDGRLLGIGRPDEVLTAQRLREAFDVEIEVSRHSSGESYVRYGNVR